MTQEKIKSIVEFIEQFVVKRGLKKIVLIDGDNYAETWDVEEVHSQKRTNTKK